MKYKIYEGKRISRGVVKSTICFLNKARLEHILYLHKRRCKNLVEWLENVYKRKNLG